MGLLQGRRARLGNEDVVPFATGISLPPIRQASSPVGCWVAGSMVGARIRTYESCDLACQVAGAT